MSERDPALLFEDIREAIAKIVRYCEGLSRDAFLADEKTCDAVVRNLEIIGEAARQMPQTVREQYPEIPWHQMAGMRNRIVHDYAGVDLGILWTVITTSLPQLAEQLKNLRE